MIPSGLDSMNRYDTGPANDIMLVHFGYQLQKGSVILSIADRTDPRLLLHRRLGLGLTCFVAGNGDFVSIISITPMNKIPTQEPSACFINPCHHVLLILTASY